MTRLSSSHLLAALSLLVLGACGAPAVQQDVGVCEAQGEAHVLGALAGRSFPMGFGSVDGHTLVITIRALTGSETSDIEYFAQWFDRNFAAESELFSLGTGRPSHRARLMAHEHALWAQLYIDQSGAIPPLQAVDVGKIWEFRPGQAPRAMGMDLAFSHDRYRPDADIPIPKISTAQLSAGAQGEMPISLAGAEVVAGINGIPASCGGYQGNRYRNLLFTPAKSQFFLWGDDPCQILPNTLMATNIQLIPLMGEVGVLFRLGSPGIATANGTSSVGGHVHFMRVNADLDLTLEPVIVGNPGWEYPTVDTGYQPKAAVVAGDRIIWNERHDLFNFSGNMCQRMHIMDADGTHVHNTPWQLPCDGNRDRYFTASSDLRSLPNGDAVIAWGERNAYGMLHAWNTHVTTDTPWEEGIYLAMVTPSGSRGSPIVKVTPPESTRLGSFPRTADDGPFPGDYLVQMAQDGDETVIAWYDLRPDAPGMWAQRYRCHRVGE